MPLILLSIHLRLPELRFCAQVQACDYLSSPVTFLFLPICSSSIPHFLSFCSLFYVCTFNDSNGTSGFSGARASGKRDEQADGGKGTGQRAAAGVGRAVSGE